MPDADARCQHDTDGFPVLGERGTEVILCEESWECVALWLSRLTYCNVGLLSRNVKRMMKFRRLWSVGNQFGLRLPLATYYRAASYSVVRRV